MATIFFTEEDQIPKHKQVIPYKKYLYISIGININFLITIILLLVLK